MPALANVTAEGKPSSVTQEKPMLKVTWRAYNVTVLNLAFKVYRSGWDPDYIVSIGRGGMPAGDAFSRMFKKTMGVIMASSYHGEGEKTQGDLEIAEHISITLKQLKGRVLLIDDLVDSGKTLAAIQRYIQERNTNIEIRTAVVYKKTSTQLIPDYFGRTINRNLWIVFPYEIFDNVFLLKLSWKKLQHSSGKRLNVAAKRMLAKL